MRRATRDLLAGLTFVAFGFAFAVVAASYEVGTALRMGPGYFPIVLGGLLALLGLLIMAKGFLAGESEAIGAIPWRGLGLILAAVLFFGFTVRGLGLVPSTFVAVLMSAFASRRTGVVAALFIAAGLTLLCVVVFVVALSLRLALVGPWLGA